MTSHNPAAVDLNVTAPDEPVDPAAEAAAAGYEPTGDDVDAAIAAWEAAVGRPMRTEEAPAGRQWECPEPDEEGAETMRDLLAEATDAQQEGPAAEIAALRAALEHALGRWPEVNGYR